jgi:hypothetical protein
VRHSLESCVADMTQAKEVVISRGPWPAKRRSDAFEFFFDDGADSPLGVIVGGSWLEAILGGDSDCGWDCADVYVRHKRQCRVRSQTSTRWKHLCEPISGTFLGMSAIMTLGRRF